MKIYAVGGQVRDEILGLRPKDKDYVVVGSTPEELLSLGYKKVGKDFPVFLHPLTGDEYALARKEKSTGDGTDDFSCEFGPEVTLEEDLYRRDLTINAMARDLETGVIIDPYGGTESIRTKVLKHVSDAFMEDPLRAFRLYRFQATLKGEWTVHLSTEALVNVMHIAGTLTKVKPERVWKEMEKALKGHTPSTFFRYLSSFKLFEEFNELFVTPQNKEHHPEGDAGIHTCMVMDYAAKNYNPEVVFAGLCHDFGKPVSYKESGNALEHEIKGLPVIEKFCDKWKVPNKYRKLALMVCEYHTKVHGCMGRGSNAKMRPKSIMKLFEDTGALKPKGLNRFLMFLNSCEADAKGRGGDYISREYHQNLYLCTCLVAVKDLDTSAISSKLKEKGTDGKIIGLEIRRARIEAIRKASTKFLENLTK